MTLADLITRVRFFIDEPTAQTFTDPQITLAINVAQQDLSKEIVHEYEDYFEKSVDLNPTIVSGSPVPGTGGTIINQDLYDLPADFLKFKRIERTDSGELIPAVDLNEKSAKVTVTSSYNGFTPIGYYVTGGSVGFTPTPTSIVPIRMWYVYRLPDLDNSVPGTSDVSLIPKEHHDILAVMAAIDCFINSQDDTTPLEKKRDLLIDQLRRTLRQRQVQDPKRVRRSDDALGILY